MHATGGRWVGLGALVAAVLGSSPALADNSTSNDRDPRRDEDQPGIPPWMQPDGEDVFYDTASVLDYEAESDLQFVPTIGGAWFGDGTGGAFTIGLGMNLWQRWSSMRSRADIGVNLLLSYQGYDGAARGRSLRMAQRIVMGAGLVHLRVGGDLGTSRYRYDFQPHLDGILTGGPAADLSILKNGSGWVGGVALDWFLGQGRPPQSESSPLADVCDELRAHAGVSFDGEEFAYQLIWNAQGPTHAVVLTFPY